MNKIVRSAIVAVALIASASAAIAAPVRDYRSQDANSASAVKQFWENQQRYGD